MRKELVRLNIGGTHQMVASRQVLTSVKGSALEKLFSGVHKLQEVDGQVFVDREGKVFELMVNYLRNGRKVWPDFKS